MNEEMQHEDFVPAPQKQGVPVEVLKRKGAINLYYTAVGALAAVVVFVPVITIWAVLPEPVWNGWNICIGGLIALIGAQGATQ
jgi:hypothetical protein